MADRIADADHAREAMRRHSWAEAYAQLRALDASGLAAEDLEALADAAWWLSKAEESISVRQRAYAAYSAAGEDPRAAFVAARLCIEYALRGDAAVAGGWLARAKRHLRATPERLEHAFLSLVESNVARFRGDVEEAMTFAQRATRIAQGFGDRDLIAMGLMSEGMAHIAAGRISEGMACLDEAMTSVVAGELSPYVTGVIYCEVLDVCLSLADVRRAGEWSEAARAWSDSLSPESPYPGLCRVFRAEVARLRGDWPQAEAEASRAYEELRGR